MANEALKSFLVIVLHITAFSLALAAEFNRNKGRPEAPGEKRCGYVSDTSKHCGIAGFICVLLSQILIAVDTKCLYRAPRPCSNCCGCFCALIFLILNWICFVKVEACFVQGGFYDLALNASSVSRLFSFEDSQSCPSRKGVYAQGAGFTVLNLILIMLYYCVFSLASENSRYSEEFDGPISYGACSPPRSTYRRDNSSSYDFDWDFDDHPISYGSDSPPRRLTFLDCDSDDERANLYYSRAYYIA